MSDTMSGLTGSTYVRFRGVEDSFLAPYQILSIWSSEAMPSAPHLHEIEFVQRAIGALQLASAQDATLIAISSRDFQLTYGLVEAVAAQASAFAAQASAFQSLGDFVPNLAMPGLGLEGVAGRQVANLTGIHRDEPEDHRAQIETGRKLMTTLHRFFAFVASGGGSILDRRDSDDPSD